MTAREQKLVKALLGILVLVVGIFVAKELVFDPLDTLSDEKKGFTKTIADNEKKLADWNKYGRTLESLNPRIAQWRKMSLPESDNFGERVRGSRAYQTHLSWLRKGYQQYLTNLLTQAGIENAKINPADKDAKAAATAPGKGPPPFQVLSFSVQEALGDQAAIRKFITALEKTTLLHQVRHFTVERQEATTSKLKLTMTIEVLLVNDAEAVAARKDKGIMPQFSGKGTDVAPNLLARDEKDYAEGDAKRIFVLKPDVVVRDDGPRIDTGQQPQGERAEDVLSYVRLTLITDSPYYNCRIARINNLGLRADATRGESVLLVDAALPSDSQFQHEKKEREKAAKDNKPVKPAADTSPIPRNPRTTPDTQETAVKAELPPLEEPARRWVIRDRYKLNVLEFQVIKIDPLRIIIQADDKFYTVAVGDTLWDAMVEPLGKEALKTLNLVADTGEVLKKVKLAKLASSTDRNGGFEATFVNADNKDEKKVLAVELARDELEAPETWVVKDRFRTEAVKIKVVKVTKDEAIFSANKKYHRIKVEQSLFDALAKPLEEDEVKTLKLPAL